MPAAARRSLAPLAVLAMLAGPARATTFVGVSERILARAADAIVIGTVEQIETVAGGDGTISTLVTLDVEEAVKGHVERRLTLKQPGGSIGGRALWIAGAPRFRTGERQLLFLSAAADGTAHTTALGMGQFVLRLHPRTGATLAERRVDGLVVGDRPLRRVPLARLLRTLARTIEQDGGGAPALLLADPPELADPGLERAPVAEFTLMDAPAARWFEADGGQPVVYQTAGQNEALGASASLAAIDGALAAWTNVSGASIVLERGGPTTPAPLSCDGISQIVFDDPFHEMPNPVACSGVLALGGYCTSAEKDVVNGKTFYRITEGNITFNQGFASCPFWNQTNLAEVATHELGHTTGRAGPCGAGRPTWQPAGRGRAPAYYWSTRAASWSTPRWEAGSSARSPRAGASATAAAAPSSRSCPAAGAAIACGSRCAASSSARTACRCSARASRSAPRPSPTRSAASAPAAATSAAADSRPRGELAPPRPSRARGRLAAHRRCGPRPCP